ncbi:GntR family transcriptional regulator [Umezawaea sp. NPDC059074]|uniref:GntR family transcriptional regulator n=1 Tax=Umezawaea sp. NPDC059074 TaxID=3346716 RepID=UPI0036C25A8A
MSLTDTVYEQLKAQILRVERAPGDVLYEAVLANEFGVSKTPVREALRLLAQTGWVVVLSRKGYIVRPVELRDVRDIFALRRMLEPTLAGEAATNATTAQVTHLRTLVDDQQQAGPDLDRALRSARQFHLALADITGSHRTRTILEDLVDEVRRLHYLLPNVESHITSAEELKAHNLILTAVAAGNATQAQALMLDHLNEVARALVTGFAGA